MPAKKKRPLGHDVKVFYLSDAFYYGAFTVINAFLSALITLKISNGDTGLVGLVIAYGMVVRIFSELVLTRFSRNLDLKGKRNLVTCSYMISGLSTMLMGFSTNIWQILALQSIYSLFDGLAYPHKWSIFTRIIDPQKTEFQWSLEDIITTLSAAIFAAFGGFLSDYFGLEAIFILFGILYISSGMTFYFIEQTQSPIK